MADYIYLLEHRLSPAQRSALRHVREVARSRSSTVFLVGGAVRDLTSGSPVRDLDVVVQGNALKLRKDLEKVGAVVTGEMEAGQALYLTFPGSVRMEVGSTLSVTYPKPNKPVLKPAGILEDLRRRDFTANAMALSLNEGSYGLLMDPLNGVADIENRELRMISNYGFIEDPIRMVRAARLMARLGWTLDERTQQRYETGRDEDYISGVSEFQRGYELEEIAFEEDPLRVLRRLEADGWMKALAPFWTTAKVNTAELDKLREAQAQLQMQGIHADASAVQFPLLTARLAAKEVESLKAMFPRQGFVAEIDGLEAKAKEFTATLTGKGAALPSQTWRLLTSAPAEVVLEVAYASRSAVVQAKFKSFFTVWPGARQKMPYALMQEMRITPELPRYEELLEALFFELMDEKLGTPEELKAFLEPYSPPAPPPTVNVRRPRAAKKESKAKARARKVEVDLDEEEVSDEVDDEAAADLPAELADALDEGLGAGSSSDEETEEEDDEEDEAGEESTPKTRAKPAPVKSARRVAEPAADKAPVRAAAAPVVVPPKKAALGKTGGTAEKHAPKAIEAKAAPVVETKAASKRVAQKAAGKTASVVAPGQPLSAVKSAAKKAVAVSAKKAATKAAVPSKKVVAAKRVSSPAKKMPVKSTPARAAEKAAPAKSALKKSVPVKKRR